MSRSGGYSGVRGFGVGYGELKPLPPLPKLSKFSVRPGIPSLPLRRSMPDVDHHVWGQGRERGGPTFQYVSEPPLSTIPPLPPPKSHLWSMSPPSWLLSSPRWGWRTHSARRSARNTSPGTPNPSVVNLSV